MTEHFLPIGESPEGIVLKKGQEKNINGDREREITESKLAILKKQVIDSIFEDGLENLQVSFSYYDFRTGRQQREMSYKDFQNQLLSGDLKYGKMPRNSMGKEVGYGLNGITGLLEDLNEILSRTMQKYLDEKASGSKKRMEDLMFRLGFDSEDLAGVVADSFKERVVLEIVDDLSRFSLDIGDGGVDTEDGEEALEAGNLDWFVDKKNYPDSLAPTFDFLKKIGLSDNSKRLLAVRVLILSRDRSDS